MPLVKRLKLEKSKFKSAWATYWESNRAKKVLKRSPQMVLKFGAQMSTTGPSDLSPQLGREVCNFYRK